MTTTRGTGAAGIAWVAAAYAALATVGGVSAARAADDLPAIEGVGVGGPPVMKPVVHHWQLSAGGRGSFFRGAGYDPFSTNDVLGQFSVTALRVFQAGGDLALAGGLLFEAGAATADARGSSADLTLTRVGVVLEPRFAPRPWAFAFARVSPAFLRGHASLSDASSPVPLGTTFSTVSLDASVGVAGKLNGRSRGVGVWAVGDAGYGWAPTQHLALTPSLADADRSKAGVTALSDLAPRGLFFRVSAAISF